MATKCTDQHPNYTYVSVGSSLVALGKNNLLCKSPKYTHTHTCIFISIRFITLYYTVDPQKKYFLVILETRTELS